MMLGQFYIYLKFNIIQKLPLDTISQGEKIAKANNTWRSLTCWHASSYLFSLKKIHKFDILG